MALREGTPSKGGVSKRRFSNLRLPPAGGVLFWARAATPYCPKQNDEWLYFLYGMSEVLLARFRCKIKARVLKVVVPIKGEAADGSCGLSNERGSAALKHAVVFLSRCERQNLFEGRRRGELACSNSVRSRYHAAHSAAKVVSYAQREGFFLTLDQPFLRTHGEAGRGGCREWRKIAILSDDELGRWVNQHVTIDGKLGRFTSALVDPAIYIEAKTIKKDWSGADDDRHSLGSRPHARKASAGVFAESEPGTERAQKAG